MTTRTIQPLDGIPLRLRRRRDGSVALTDARGVVDAASYPVPAQHLFMYRWLFGEGSAVATLSDGAITLNLANATLTYEVASDEDSAALLVAMADHKGSVLGQPEENQAAVAQGLSSQGIVGRLVHGDVFDAPPIEGN